MELLITDILEKKEEKRREVGICRGKRKGEIGMSYREKRMREGEREREREEAFTLLFCSSNGH